MSTPKGDGSFNVYDDIRSKLLNAGVPEQEIEFIHNADTEDKKGGTVLQSALRTMCEFCSEVRQKWERAPTSRSRLVAVHHLDVGWKPSLT